jgi:hypothetical protein
MGARPVHFHNKIVMGLEYIGLKIKDFLALVQVNFAALFGGRKATPRII